MVLNPSSFAAGASLLSIGMSVPAATVAHALGGIFLLAALIANAWAGVKYGIPFPVLSRASFGYYGSQFCTLSRGAVAIMWLSFQLWQGAQALATGLVATSHALGATRQAPNGQPSPLQLLVYFAFAAAHWMLIAVGPERLRPLVNVTAPLLLCGLVALMFWAAHLAPIDAAFSRLGSNRSHVVEVAMPTSLQWLAAINSATSTWSTLVLNVCDLARYAPTQRAQILGQTVGLPVPFALTGFVGAWIAGASYVATGTAVWQVPQYFALMAPLPAVVGSLVLAVSVLVVNVVANMLSPINDLLNLFPLLEGRAPRLARSMTFQSCAALTLVLAVAVCPWWTFSSASRFVLVFLNGYGMLTGAIAGVMICDFWLIRRASLDVHSLYRVRRRARCHEAASRSSVARGGKARSGKARDATCDGERAESPAPSLPCGHGVLEAEHTVTKLVVWVTGQLSWITTRETIRTSLQLVLLWRPTKTGPTKS